MDGNEGRGRGNQVNEMGQGKPGKGNRSGEIGRRKWGREKRVKEIGQGKSAVYLVLN